MPEIKTNQVWLTEENDKVFIISLPDDTDGLGFLWWDEINNEWTANPLIRNHLFMQLEENFALDSFVRTFDWPVEKHSKV